MIYQIKTLISKILNSKPLDKPEYNTDNKFNSFKSEFSDFTNVFVEFVKNLYSIKDPDDNGNYSKGFFSLTEGEGIPCFCNKFIDKNGVNVWFVMLYEDDTREITELHVFSSSQGLNRQYSKEYIEKYRCSYDLKNELELILPSVAKTNSSNLIKI